MAAKASLFLAVLLLVTLDFVPLAVGRTPYENMLKSAGEKMETPFKPSNTLAAGGINATGAEEEKGYFAGHVFGGPPRLPPCSRAMLC
ncbi:hypothetical protein C2845_PM15G23370 [Panicum miliaceum]|uniref:Uncharacterized protein n=1 Tax=Panicum miliaceum TaxID=4540 RepID=A0A3L6Q5D3_PANMI|nr:hypothetical protein C2845_PM15G23370 [Panicum miliaceum]